MDIGHVGKTTIENRDRENCHIQSFTFHNIRVALKVFLADGHQCSAAGPAYPANILSALLDPILSRSNDYTIYVVLGLWSTLRASTFIGSADRLRNSWPICRMTLPEAFSSYDFGEHTGAAKHFSPEANIILCQLCKLLNGLWDDAIWKKTWKYT